MQMQAATCAGNDVLHSTSHATDRSMQCHDMLASSMRGSKAIQINAVMRHEHDGLTSKLSCTVGH